MSQTAPGKFASEKEKECAKKTGYAFPEPMVDPTGEKTNSEAVRKAYKECLGVPTGTGDSKKIFTTKTIVIAVVVIVIILVGAYMMSKVHRNAP